MTRWRPYPEYKDSGVPWLGEIPLEWRTTQIKYGYEVRLGKMLASEPSSSLDTLESYLRTANVYWEGIDTSDIHEMWFSPSEKAQYRLEPGDLVVCEGGDVGRSAIWKEELPECYIQNAVHRVHGKDGYSNRFLYYWLFALKRAGYIDLICSKATIAHLTAEKLTAILIVVPSPKEQRAIAAFLDHQTVKIDVAITEYGRLIKLLQEKRAAFISRAVIQGIDPDVPRKDSGVEWLGEIPARWDVKKVKYLTSMISKGTTPTTLGAEFVDEGIRFVKAENISNGKVTDIPAVYIDAATNRLLTRSVLRADDVLMVIAGATTGKVAIIRDEQLPANTNQAVAFIRPKAKEAPQFLYYWLSSQLLQEEVWLNAVQAAQPNLSLEDIGNFIMPFPPLPEQHTIATLLDRETAKIDALIAEIETGIAHLEEYRTALISAAVTGKIDVRDALPADAPAQPHSTEPQGARHAHQRHRSQF